ncbi:MAG TPA: DUF3617 family protein [Bauldia sp.]|nr:DUF3617 family protein [Bauldia sp.]
MKLESIALALIAAAIALPAAADELNLPARKSGEWQLTMQVAGHQMVTKQCVDEATDKEMMQSSFAQAGSKCSSIKQSQDGNTFTVDATCSLNGGITTNTHAVVTGDFQSEYTVDAVTDMTGGPPQMPKHSEIKQDVKWVGACPAGTQPGDIEMPGLPAGMKLNLKQLQMMKPPG